MGVRITSWNVNGIRNPFGYQPWREKRTFDAMFDTLEADIVIFQELKIQRKDLRDDMVLVPGWDVFFSLPRHKKGYSGVAIYTRQDICCPIRAEEGLLGVLCPPNTSVPYRDMDPSQHIGGYLSQIQMDDLNVDPAFLDSEGRCVILEFPAFVLFGIYSPANSSGTRDDFRHGFLVALDLRIRNLSQAGKRVVVCGDLNVSREEIDTANAEESIRKEGLTHDDYISTPNRRIFNQLLEGGAVSGPRDAGREQPVLWDVCRGFHPQRQGMFTHWEQKINARPGNFGSRIDFVLSSTDMKGWFSSSDIQEGLMGSDHCPVYAVLKDSISIDNEQRSLVDVLNPAGMFEDGRRARSCTTKDMPAFSAKLLPEFDKRRSIKDMFSRKSSNGVVPSDINAGVVATKSNDLSQQETQDSVASQTFTVAQSSQPRNQSERTLPIQETTGSKMKADRKRPGPPVSSPRASKQRSQGRSNESLSQSLSTQKTLKGFFKPSAQVEQAPKECSEPESHCHSDARPNVRESDQIDVIHPVTVPESGRDERVEQAMTDEDLIVDPAVSKASWSKLLSKPIAPLCEHEEPCKLMKTKKAGYNCGREFWMCQRPLGPSGEKERKTQWRCPTFIWSSDRKSNAS